MILSYFRSSIKSSPKHRRGSRSTPSLSTTVCQRAIRPRRRGKVQEGPNNESRHNSVCRHEAQTSTSSLSIWPPDIAVLATPLSYLWIQYNNIVVLIVDYDTTGIDVTSDFESTGLYNWPYDSYNVKGHALLLYDAAMCCARYLRDTCARQKWVI